MVSASSDWWKTFFEGLALEAWNLAIPDEMTRAEVNGIVKMLDLEPGERVLDAPCGSGRLAIGIAGHGCIVAGIDIAEDNIARCRQSATLAVDARCGDVLELDRIFAGELDFDAAICFGNSFGYFDDEGNADFVRQLHAALREGGRLLVDAPMMLSTFESKTELEKDWGEFPVEPPFFFLTQGRYDPATKRWHDDNVMIQGAKTTRRSMCQRVWTSEELRDLFASAGFSKVEHFGDLEGAAWEPDSSASYIRAIK